MNQLQLFERPAPARGLGGQPPDVERRWNLAFSELVKAELVARLNERPGQWLAWCDFDDIRERHDIGFCMGHVLFRLFMEGRALRKEVYFGAERPGDPFQPYLGFKNVWSSAEHGPANETTTRTRTE